MGPATPQTTAAAAAAESPPTRLVSQRSIPSATPSTHWPAPRASGVGSVATIISLPDAEPISTTDCGKPTPLLSRSPAARRARPACPQHQPYEQAESRLSA